MSGLTNRFVNYLGAILHVVRALDPSLLGDMVGEELTGQEEEQNCNL